MTSCTGQALDAEERHAIKALVTTTMTSLNGEDARAQRDNEQQRRQQRERRRKPDDFLQFHLQSATLADHLVAERLQQRLGLAVDRHLAAPLSLIVKRTAVRSTMRSSMIVS